MTRVFAVFLFMCAALFFAPAQPSAKDIEPLRLQEGSVRVFSLTPYLAPHKEGLGHIFAIRNAGADVLVVNLHRTMTNNPFAFTSPIQNPLRLIAANDEAFVASPDTPNVVAFTIAPRDVQSFLLLGDYNPADIYLWSPLYEAEFLEKRQTMRQSLLVIMFALLLITAIAAALTRNLFYGGATILTALTFLIGLRLWGYWQAEVSVWGLLLLLVALRGGLFYWRRQPLYVFDMGLGLGLLFWAAAALRLGDALQIYEIGTITLLLGGIFSSGQILYALCQSTFMADST